MFLVIVVQYSDKMKIVKRLFVTRRPGDMVTRRKKAEVNGELRIVNPENSEHTGISRLAALARRVM